jgi:hypothetical protein
MKTGHLGDGNPGGPHIVLPRIVGRLKVIAEIHSLVRKGRHMLGGQT